MIAAVQAGASRLCFGVTSAHPFWSVTRDGFVPAGDLEYGEQVVTIDGQLWHLTTITPRAGPETVYNFEVAGEHVYYAGSNGLLVHNLYIYDGAKAIAGGSYKAALLASRGLKALPGNAVAAAKRLKGAIHGHHIVMKGANKGLRGVYSRYSRNLLEKAFGKNGVNDVRNLAFAVNSKLGIHSTAYAKAVAKNLQAASKKSGNLADNLTKALDDMRDTLENGQKFW